MRNSIINGANKDLINCLCECIFNTLKGNVELKDDDKNKNFQKTKTKIKKTMDFYITLTSGPIKHQPDYETTWCEYRPQKPIELDGEYEVALVQSIFKNVQSICIATINIFPPSKNMKCYLLKYAANDGESVETIIKNANYKLMVWASSQLGGKPKIVLNEDNLEFSLDVPEGWAYYVMDVDKNHIDESYEIL
ncbi:unnamed protein product [Brachionus calyciflorus]|uniref:Uncharacterized protein n=1 Tax=Brachionus calyciflorus TaxID=104777 RepID=A0A813SLN9_9BILA|nr:unnamed protein product [Brachionus calyciflorus]